MILLIITGEWQKKNILWRKNKSLKRSADIVLGY